MSKKSMEGKQSVEIVPERRIILEYYLLSDVNEENQVFYGAEIHKTDAGSREIETVKGITESREEAEELIALLIRNQVTPISMTEIIDDYITEKACS